MAKAFDEAPGVVDASKNVQDAKETFQEFLKVAKQQNLTLEQMVSKWMVIDKLVGATGKTAQNGMTELTEIISEVMRGADNLQSILASIGKTEPGISGDLLKFLNELSSGGGIEDVNQYITKMSAGGNITGWFLNQMRGLGKEIDDSSDSLEGMSTQLAKLIKRLGPARDKMSNLFSTSHFRAAANSTAIISDHLKTLQDEMYELSNESVSVTANIGEIRNNLGAEKFTIDGNTLKFQDALEAVRAKLDPLKNDLEGIQRHLQQSAKGFQELVAGSLQDSGLVDETGQRIMSMPGLDAKTTEELQANWQKVANQIAEGLIPAGKELDQLQAQLYGLNDVNPDLASSLMKELAVIRQMTSDTVALTNQIGISEQSLNELKFTKNLFVQIRGAAENVRNTIISTLGVLPGWIQNLIGVSDIANRLSESLDIGLKNAAGRYEELIESGANWGEAVTGAVGEVTNSMRGALAGLGTFAATFAVIAGLLAITILLGNRIEGISKDLGISKQQALELHKGMMMTNDASKASLLTMQDMVDVQKAHIEQTGKILDLHDEANRAQVQFASNMANAYGAGIGDVYRMMHEFQELGADKTMSQQLTQWVGRAAELNGISFDTIAKDLAESAEFVAMHFSGMPKDAAKAVVEVRKMGTSLKQVGQIYENMVDVDSFMGSMHELAAMAGADLSVAFNMRMTGAEPHEVMEEIWKQYDNLSDSMKSNEFINKQFANTLGMSVDELKASEKIRRFSKNLSEEELELVQAHAGALSDQDLMNQENLKTKAEELATQKQMAAQMDRIKGQLAQALLPLAQLFADVFTALMPVFDILGLALKLIGALIKPFIPVFKLIGFLVESISFVLGGIVSTLSKLVDEVNLWLEDMLGLDEVTGSINEYFSKISGWLKGIVGTALVLTGIFMKWPNLLGSLNIFSSLKNMKLGGIFKSKGVEAGTSFLGGWKNKLSGMKDKVFGKFHKGGQLMKGGGQAQTEGQRKGGLLTKVKDKLGGIFSKGDKKSVTQTESIGKRLSGTFSKMKKSIGEGANKIGTTIGKFFKSIGEALKKVNTNSMIKAAVALGILAGALWVTGKAVQQFVDISWEDLGKAGAALAGLAFTAFLIGKMQGQILQGAFALAILGGALVPLAFALNLITDVDFNDLAVLGTALLGLTLAVIGLGAIMMSGVGAAALMSGAAALAILGAALIPLAIALKIVGSAMDSFKGFDPKILFGMAKGFMALGAAMAFLTYSAFGAMFGAGPLGGIMKAAEHAPQIERFANAVMKLAEALQMISNVGANGSVSTTISESTEAMVQATAKTSEIEQAIPKIQAPTNTYNSSSTTNSNSSQTTKVNMNMKNVELLLKQLIRTVEKNSLKEVPLVIGSAKGRQLNAYLKKFN